MKINYISHLDPYSFNGGGEMVMRDIIDGGRVRGLDIEVISARPDYQKELPEADIHILCDLFNEPTRKERLSRNLIEKVVYKKKYVHFDNSYVDVCDLDYLPCNGANSGGCKYKSIYNLRQNIRRRSFNKDCFQNNPIVKDLYNNSIFNTFVSPLHKNIIYRQLRLDKNDDFILKPTVDTDIFYNQKNERDIDYIFAGAISEAKGIENLMRFFSGRKERLVLIGKDLYGKKLPFADYVGFLPYEEMPKYFNRAKNFVYLPRWPEPQGRVVVEAALCGCNLITNENVGATSFDFDISDPTNLAGAVDEFWAHFIAKAQGANAI